MQTLGPQTVRRGNSPGLAGRKPGMVTNSLCNQRESQICPSSNGLIFQRIKISVLPIWQEYDKQRGDGGENFTRPRPRAQRATDQGGGDCMPHGSHDRSLSRLLVLDLGEVTSVVRVCGWIMTKARGLEESLW